VTVGLAGCSHSTSGLGRLTADGQVQVTAGHAAPHAGHTGDVLKVGDRVVVTTGRAGVRLMSGGDVQLRSGAELTIDKVPYLTGGAILIQPSGHSIEIAAQAATLVILSGVAQLSISSPAPNVPTSLTAKVYLGTAQLDIAGNPPAPIAAPRQIVLTTETRLPVQAVPLHYQDSDTWDHQYLAEAIGISTQLGAVATGFNAQVPVSQGTTAAFYEALLPTLNAQPDFDIAFQALQQVPTAGSAGLAKPGDYLIASVIALRGSRGTFENRLSDELAFSAQGAPWGFVAYDQGVTDLSGVLNDVLAAVSRATLPQGGSPASQIAIGPPGTVTLTPTTRPGRQPTTTTTPVNPRLPHPTTTTTTSTPPLIQLPVPVLPGPLGSLLNPLLDPLIQALNNVLAGRH
jgi:hypothetical protein